MQFKYIIFILLSVLFFNSCGDEEVDPVGVTNIEGSASWKNLNYELVGGVIDKYEVQVYKDRYTYKFKISDHPINFSRGDSVYVYVSSEENINFTFYLTSQGSTNLMEGEYIYTELEPGDDNFPPGNVLHIPILTLGERSPSVSKATNFFPESGKVIITGTFPELKIDINFDFEDGTTATASATGTFITEENYLDFFPE